MIITIQEAEGSEITLIDGPVRDVNKTAGPTAITGSVSLSPQVRRPLRAAAAKPLQRGGRTGEGTFSGTRLCATEDAAAAWLSSHLGALPHSGTLRFKVGSTTRLTISDAVITNVNWRQHGATMHIDYKYIGGALS
jgi:hypothetical protein